MRTKDQIKTYQHSYYLKNREKFRLARKLDYIKNMDAYKERSRKQAKNENKI